MSLVAVNFNSTICLFNIEVIKHEVDEFDEILHMKTILKDAYSDEQMKLLSSTRYRFATNEKH